MAMPEDEGREAGFSMSVRSIKACVKVAACICGKDGVISELEELKMFEILHARFPECDEELFDEAMNEFFESNEQIESSLALISDHELRRFTLELAETSAGADGLDPRENVALEKSYEIWEISRHA